MHIVIDARNRRSSTGRYTDRLVHYLTQIDHHNQYTILVQPDDEWQLKGKNFVTTVCKYKQFSFNPLEQWGFARQLYRLHPSVVHFTMPQQPLFYFGNIVITTHDLTFLQYPRTKRAGVVGYALRTRLYRLLLWWSHKKSSKVIVPTEYVRDAVAKKYLFTNRKLVVTREASEAPKPVQAKAPNYAPEQFLLYVGSSFPHKNLRRLIKALAVLNRTQPDLKLLIVGKQEYYSKKLQRWAKTHNMQNAIFTGFVSDEELEWLYEHCQAYVFPSLSEGFGLPGLEAMAHGTPVISSNATSLPEVYGEAAMYFNPSDTENMAKVIARVLANDKLRHDLIAKGHKQVKKYSWQKMAEQTLEVYQSFSS